MDALTSQANVAGYKAAVLGPPTPYGGFFPMLITAAGTTRPAGSWCSAPASPGCRRSPPPAGSAPWSPATTCGRQPRTRSTSLGARCVDLRRRRGRGGTGEGGYARELTAEEQHGPAGRAGRRGSARLDVVITTAQVPGRTPPLLVTAEALAAMRPGSVVVDLAAGDARRQRRGLDAGRAPSSPTAA